MTARPEPMSEGTRLRREASTPVRSGAQGTVAAAIGQAISTTIVASNPELMPFAFMIGTGVTGVLNGIGTAARNRVHSGKGGPVTFFAHVFAWLG
jgi:hypothetical protein